MPLNGMEEVVEVVSDPACKPPDGLQTLIVFRADPPLFQFLFQPGAAGDVTPENDVLRLGILLRTERRKCKVQHSVRSGKIHCNRIRRFILPYFGSESGEGLKILSVRHSGKFLCGMVCIEDRSLFIDDHDHVTRPFKKQLVPFFRPAQVFFQCLGLSIVAEKCKHNIKSPSAGTRFFLIDPAEIDSGHDPDPNHRKHVGEVGFRERTPPVIAAEVVDNHKEQTIKELYQSQRPDHGNDQTAVPVPEPLIQDRQQENIHRKRNHSRHHRSQGKGQQFTECERLFFTHSADQLLCQIRQIKIKDQRKDHADHDPLGGKSAFRDVNDHHGSEKRQQKTGRHQIEVEPGQIRNDPEARRANQFHKHKKQPERNTETSRANDFPQSMQQQKPGINKCHSKKSQKSGINNTHEADTPPKALRRYSARLTARCSPVTFSGSGNLALT